MAKLAREVAGARPLSFVETQASVLLDLVRGLAALLVLGEHWRNLFFVDYPQLPAHKLLWAVPYVLTGAGHQAVVIFFVLSGYLISGSIFRALKRDQWSWASYMTHRVVRLWVVLLPGLLLCAAFDTLGLDLHRAPLMYVGLGLNHMIPDVQAALKVRTFFGNLFFVQTIRVPIFGSDGALWSLANEFWYYMLFPLILLAARRERIVWRLGYMAVFVLVGWFVGAPILLGFPMWLAGVALAMTPPPSCGSRVRWAVAVVYVPVVFFLAKYQGLSSVTSDYLLAVATFLLLWVLLSAKGRAEPTAAVRGSRMLARFSFTLYVVHTPFLLLLKSILLKDHRWVPTPGHVLAGLCVLLVTLVFAYGVAWATEFRTDELRGWVESRFHVVWRAHQSRRNSLASR